MIRIHLVAQERPDTLNLSVSGSTLSINGDDLDLSAMAVGSEIAQWQAQQLSPFIAGRIWVDDEATHTTLFLPYRGDCTDAHVLQPDPIDVTEDGPVDLPFVTYSEVTEEPADGGRNVTTTTYRWHQEPEVHTVFEATRHWLRRMHDGADNDPRWLHHHG